MFDSYIALTNKVKTTIFSPPLQSLDVWNLYFEWRACSSFKSAWNQLSSLAPSVLLLPLLLSLISCPLFSPADFFSLHSPEFWFTFSVVSICFSAFSQSISIHLASQICHVAPAPPPVTELVCLLRKALLFVRLCAAVCAHVNIFIHSNTLKLQHQRLLISWSHLENRKQFFFAQVYLFILPGEILHSTKNMNRLIEFSIYDSIKSNFIVPEHISHFF